MGEPRIKFSEVSLVSISLWAFLMQSRLVCSKLVASPLAALRTAPKRKASLARRVSLRKRKESATARGDAHVASAIAPGRAGLTCEKRYGGRLREC